MHPDQMQNELNKHGIDAKTRTNQQNNAIHLSFRQFANELNDAGWSLSKALDAGKINLEIGWTEDNIKAIFKAVMVHQLPNKQWRDPDNPSTTELETVELQQCWEVLNRAMGDKFGVTLPFPSVEAMYYNAVYK